MSIQQILWSVTVLVYYSVHIKLRTESNMYLMIFVSSKLWVLGTSVYWDNSKLMMRVPIVRVRM